MFCDLVFPIKKIYGPCVLELMPPISAGINMHVFNVSNGLKGQFCCGQDRVAGQLKLCRRLLILLLSLSYSSFCLEGDGAFS